jgi:hypothetical protein
VEKLNSLGGDWAQVVEANIANHQTLAGEIDKVRDAREMKTIQGNCAAKTREMGQRT